jgi:hypothetical protein
MPVILRILGIAGKFFVRNWKTIAITLGLVAATGFVFGDAMSQAATTLERFIWLGIVVLLLLAIIQFLKFLTAGKRRD